MCLALPYMGASRRGGSHVGRWLRARPARLTRAAGWLALALGLVLAIAGRPLGLGSNGWDWGWPLLLLSQGSGALLLAGLLDRLPGPCRVSELGYPGHAAQATALLLGALLTAGGCFGLGAWVAAGGSLLLLLAWRLAAGPLRWQIAWCRLKPSPILQRLPLALNAGGAGVAVLVVGAWFRLDGLQLAGSALLLGSFTLLALGLHQTAWLSGDA